MSVRIDGRAFRLALADLGGDISQAAGEALESAVDAAARDAFTTNLFRNKTWKLREGTKATVDRQNYTGRLENRVAYARFVEEGTKPHVIQARNAPVLRFFWTRHGFWFAGKKVNHPGTAPRPFFKHAGEVGASQFERSATHLVDQTITRYNRAA